MNLSSLVLGVEVLCRSSVTGLVEVAAAACLISTVTVYLVPLFSSYLFASGGGVCVQYHAHSLEGKSWSWLRERGALRSKQQRGMTKPADDTPFPREQRAVLYCTVLQ